MPVEIGDGVYRRGGQTFTVSNWIVADNPTAGDCNDTLTSLGHNLGSRQTLQNNPAMFVARWAGLLRIAPAILGHRICKIRDSLLVMSDAM